MSTLAAFVTADTIAPVTTRLEDGYQIGLKIADLQKEIESLQEQQALIIEDHINAGITEEGPFSIKKKVSKRETLDPDAFAEKYPEEFGELWRELGQAKFKPSKTDAAKVLTSHQIEKICKKSESVTYSIDWDMHQGAEL